MPFAAIARTLAVSTLMAAATLPAAAADLVLEDYFAGKTYANGRFSAIDGTSRAFAVELTGAWDGKVLRLREDFVYDDGERDTKTWVFTRTEGGGYKGTREDVVGETTVYLDGPKAGFTYRVDLAPDGDPNIVRFFDTLILAEDGTIANTALVTKYGLPVARVRVNFARTKAEADAIKP